MLLCEVARYAAGVNRWGQCAENGNVHNNVNQQWIEV